MALVLDLELEEGIKKIDLSQYVNTEGVYEGPENSFSKGEQFFGGREDIKSLGSLKRLEGEKHLQFLLNLEDLGSLEATDGIIDFSLCVRIESLAKLAKTSGKLIFSQCASLSSLGDLESVSASKFGPGDLLIYKCPKLKDIAGLKRVEGDLHISVGLPVDTLEFLGGKLVLHVDFSDETLETNIKEYQEVLKSIHEATVMDRVRLKMNLPDIYKDYFRTYK